MTVELCTPNPATEGVHQTSAVPETIGIMVSGCTSDLARFSTPLHLWKKKKGGGRQGRERKKERKKTEKRGTKKLKMFLLLQHFVLIRDWTESFSKMKQNMSSSLTFLSNVKINVSTIISLFWVTPESRKGDLSW